MRKQVTFSSGLQKERKQELVNTGLVRCGFCRANRKENKKRRPRPDKQKKIHRDSIRVPVFVEEVVTEGDGCGECFQVCTSIDMIFCRK